MNKINIIETELLNLFDAHIDFCTGYIDRQTGNILVVLEDCDEPEQEEIIEKIAQERDRYLTIEPINSNQGFKLMEQFVINLPESEDQNLLTKVLSWKNPFSNFKSALLDMGDLRQHWFDFRNKEIHKLMVEWLKSEDICAELVPYNEK